MGGRGTTMASDLGGVVMQRVPLRIWIVLALAALVILTFVAPAVSGDAGSGSASSGVISVSY
jgi:hypothetical protein